MRVKPRESSLIVRDPDTRRTLPPEGAEVPDTTFWRRRLRDGDVVLVEAAAPTGLEPVAPLTTRGER